jgi:hypothetical protein
MSESYYAVACIGKTSTAQISSRYWAIGGMMVHIALRIFAQTDKQPWTA